MHVLVNLYVSKQLISYFLSVTDLSHLFVSEVHPASVLSSSSQLSPSHSVNSSLLDTHHHSGAWRPATDDPHPWLQLDLDDVKVIVKVATQGHTDVTEGQWVTSYKLQTSFGGDLEFVLDQNGMEMIFAGNSDSVAVMENYLDFVQANRIRLLPETCHEIALRWDVYTLPYDDGMSM